MFGGKKYKHIHRIFYSLEDVGRGSKTQLQVSGNVKRR